MSLCNARTRLFLCLSLLICLVFTALPTHAADIFYTIKGTNIQVTPAGTNARNPHGVKCPLERVNLSDEDYKKAITAANGTKFQGQIETQSAPHAISSDKKTAIYFASCKKFFERQAYNSVTKTTDAVIACSYIGPGPKRLGCMNLLDTKQSIVASDGARVANATDTVLPGPSEQTGQSKEDVAKITSSVEEKKKLKNDCFNGTFDRIEKYWADKQGVQCVAAAKRTITGILNGELRELARHIKSVVMTLTQTKTTGSSPGVLMPMLSVIDMIQAGVQGVLAVKQAADLGNEFAKGLDMLLGDCLGVTDALSKFKDITSAGVCKSLENLVERQLTQCIRVNVGLNLSLPQFTLALQCPIKVNVSAYLDANGLQYDSSIEGCSPIANASVGGWNGGSSLSKSGGMEGMFSGKCFKSRTTVPSGSTAPVAGTRIAGVDCGPLNMTAEIRKETLKGTRVLTPGKATNGWGIGGNETVKSPDTNVAQMITRCDYYESGRRKRSAYVYGAGSSCNDGANGFLESGYETNTTCYPGGYQVFDAPPIPDACLYPIDCLNTVNYQFEDANRGKGNCLANIQPVLNKESKYPVANITGGVGAGDPAKDWLSCANFETELDPAPVCCDPQTQNCLPEAVGGRRKPGVELCKCDQGDANNTVDPNQTDGRCLQGGAITCCTASLQTSSTYKSGKAGCAAIGMGATAMCAEPAEQCLSDGKPGDVSTITLPNGSTKPLTPSRLNDAKPSPYTYLFVQPDVQLPGGKQCCTTPWCNICPQHYANAYGLALQRSTGFAKPTSVQGNNAIIGKGWPYLSSRDEDTGETSFSIGVNPLYVVFTKDRRIGGSKDEVRTIKFPTLFISDGLRDKPYQESFTACNNLSQWKASYAPSNNFDNGSAVMGYTYDKIYGGGKKKDEWHTIGPVPDIQEYPMDYINRILTATNSGSDEPPPTVELCSSAMKLCLPSDTYNGTNSGTGTGTDGGTTVSTGGSDLDSEFADPDPGADPTTGGTSGGADPTGASGTTIDNGRVAQPSISSTTTVAPAAARVAPAATVAPAPVVAPAARAVAPTAVPSAGATTGTGRLF